MQCINTGLTHRVPIAASRGILDNTGASVTAVNPNSGQLLKAAIVTLLTSQPNAGIDLGAHGVLFQFLPDHHFTSKMDELIANNEWLRHRGGTFAPTAAETAALLQPQIQWDPIVTFCQVVAITRRNAAVGPTDVVHYFNR